MDVLTWRCPNYKEKLFFFLLFGQSFSILCKYLWWHEKLGSVIYKIFREIVARTAFYSYRPVKIRNHDLPESYFFNILLMKYDQPYHLDISSISTTMRLLESKLRIFCRLAERLPSKFRITKNANIKIEKRFTYDYFSVTTQPYPAYEGIWY